MVSKHHIDCGKSKTKLISSFSPHLKILQQQDVDVIHVETVYSWFPVEHDIALSVANLVGKLFQEMFPGSHIAWDY